MKKLSVLLRTAVLFGCISAWAGESAVKTAAPAPAAEQPEQAKPLNPGFTRRFGENRRCDDRHDSRRKIRSADRKRQYGHLPEKRSIDLHRSPAQRGDSAVRARLRREGRRPLSVGSAPKIRPRPNPVPSAASPSSGYGGGTRKREPFRLDAKHAFRPAEPPVADRTLGAAEPQYDAELAVPAPESDSPLSGGFENDETKAAYLFRCRISRRCTAIFSRNAISAAIFWYCTRQPRCRPGHLAGVAVRQIHRQFSAMGKMDHSAGAGAHLLGADRFHRFLPDLSRKPSTAIRTVFLAACRVCIAGIRGTHHHSVRSRGIGFRTCRTR